MSSLAKQTLSSTTCGVIAYSASFGTVVALSIQRLRQGIPGAAVLVHLRDKTRRLFEGHILVGIH